ncbi:hypothetical protein JVU11DRAFT_8682 [Chiua virens]|nr:hypothetical protein JVU11DRAFT_8682 [Chiua virens]
MVWHSTVFSLEIADVVRAKFAGTWSLVATRRVPVELGKLGPVVMQMMFGGVASPPSTGDLSFMHHVHELPMLAFCPGCSRRKETKLKIPREAISAEVPGTDVHSESAESRTGKTAEENVAAESGPKVGSQEAPDQKKETISEWASAAAVAAAGGMVGTSPDPEGLGEKAGAVKDIEGSNLDSATLGQNKIPSEGTQGSEEEHKEEQTTGTPSGKVEEGEYHPAQLHPPPPGASVAEYRSSHGQQEAQDAQDARTTTETGKRESVSGEKKPGFMTMMKGEIKIIAGKMSGDEHKVEEGKKLVHGEA